VARRVGGVAGELSELVRKEERKSDGVVREQRSNADLRSTDRSVTGLASSCRPKKDLCYTVGTLQQRHTRHPARAPRVRGTRGAGRLRRQAGYQRGRVDPDRRSPRSRLRDDTRPEAPRGCRHSSVRARGGAAARVAHGSIRVIADPRCARAARPPKNAFALTPFPRNALALPPIRLIHPPGSGHPVPHPDTSVTTASRRTRRQVQVGV
jgi:hypothetical protein